MLQLILCLILFAKVESNEGVEKPDGLAATDLMYIECKLTRMCAFLSESWLETQGITEDDTDFLTLNDRSCAAQDFGSFEGLGDEHFWVWCSREETEEERLEHGDEPGGLAHYDCGTDTGIHSGESGANGWQIEPHIRHNNSITTPANKMDKKIHIPWECEWPTTSVGDNPLGFRITGPKNVTYDTTQSKAIKGEYPGNVLFGI